MRRTLALAGAAVLGITGLAGPASADSGAEIMTIEGVFFNELAAELDGSTGPVGGYLELINTTGGVVSIADWVLVACDSTHEFDPLPIPNDAAAVLPAGGTYLIGDFAYSNVLAPADLTFPSSDEVLERVGSGMQLTNDGTGAEVQEELKWDSADTTCAGFDDIGTTPTASQSAHRDTPSWTLGNPTPQPS